MQYFILKSLHILSVVLFLGNIITGVFWKYHGDRVGTASARVQALDGVIRSDRWFTLPGVVAIIVTGVLLAMTLHLPILGTFWILWSLILFGISGVAFQFFVAPLQRNCWPWRAPARRATGTAEYERLSGVETVGAVATLAPVIALVRMVCEGGRRDAGSRASRTGSSLQSRCVGKAGRRACRDIRQCS